MTTLLGVHSLCKSFGTQKLFENISFTVSQKDRIGLLGINGSGKSTLLKILMNIEHPDEGHVTRRQNIRIGYASQLPEFPSQDLESILLQENSFGTEEDKRIRAQILLGKFCFPDSTKDASTLSGGWKKRLDIAKSLMNEPDLLLLDEPTNHLDLESITWLESFLRRENLSYMIVSHDRYFLENVCNKIIELGKCYPQGVFVAQGTYSDFMEQKEAFLESQCQQEKGLASVLRDEIDWLRRSPKARTTKSRSRIQRAYELMEEVSQVKQRNKRVKVAIEFSASERETRKLLSTKNLTKSINGKTLFKGIELTLSPGSRLGIVGKNGTGKTTLLKTLAGQIPHDSGTIKYADELRLVYFDQHRESIPSDITLKTALSPNGDYVTYHGQPIHVHGWAKKFLFPTDRLELPVKYLSGGERARILIAKLILEPADILFLDEPTNDLDIQTLEVIEESLEEFAGAVVLITHDRCLMDRICTQIIGLGEGKETTLFAEYSQWAREIENTPSKQKSESLQTPKEVNPPSKKKLSYNEQRELDGMEARIDQIEKEVSSLEQKLALSFDSQLCLQLASAVEQKNALYERWHHLEEKQT